MIEQKEIRHFHLFCGIGAGAKGFNKGEARVGNTVAKFRCIGGVDNNPGALKDFARFTGVQGTLIDLFDRLQYIAYWGKEPPPGWKEAIPADIRRAAGNERPHIVFLSSPCKGLSGLVSELLSKTDKYQALNRLTVRGIMLMLEAWKDDPPELIVFENVPRIATRGRHLLDIIVGLLESYGYAVAETTHDCGELGGLAQSRKRFLLVARHIEKVPPFLYEPEKRSLRAVGSVLGRMPLPGDLAGGPMHRIPNLHWKTWVRLAFVEAGSDWRSLNKLSIKDGHLKDFLIVPDFRADYLGVHRWSDHAGCVGGRSMPTNGAYSIADPRPGYGPSTHPNVLGVADWGATSNTITSESRPSTGRFAVSAPRFNDKGGDYKQYGLCGWDETMGAVINVKSPGQGTFAVQDPRLTVKHNNCFRIVRFDQAAGTVTGGAGPSAGGQGVADPRPPTGPLFSKYKVTDWAQNAGTVIGGDDQGAYAVADPRAPDRENYTVRKYKVTDWDKSTNTVIGASTAGDGAFAVADPRPNMDRQKGDNYLTGGHYGVVPWSQPSGAVSAAAGHDNGRWSVADPRMPEPNEKMVAIIRALDGTWHRPFTTLELAALQSLVEPEEYLELDGLSDQAWRERIGNAVPPAAAEAIASVMGTTLLLAWSGETFRLSSTPIWVRPVAIALSVRAAVE